MAPTLHCKNGRGNTFFTERRHSEQSGVGLTGSYETPRIAQAEVWQKCANSILVRRVNSVPAGFTLASKVRVTPTVVQIPGGEFCTENAGLSKIIL